MRRTISGRTAAAVLASGLALAPSSAAAFCGFFVGSAGEPLRSRAASVVLMREGTRTVVTIQSAYDGPPEDFALVVPVPQVLRRGQVKTLEREVMARVETLSAPRLVEYWEQDPCRDAGRSRSAEESRYVVDGQNATSPAFGSVGAGWASRRERVRVEARFAAGEYDVVILGARDSTRLTAWLRERGYAIPDGADTALRPYVQAGMKFFVARVAIDRVQRDAQGTAVLSPLRFHYDSERFELPVRLGLLNADGPQDLVVYVLAHGRYQAASRDNVAIPTNLEVRPASRAVFSSVYAALFDRVLAARPGAVVTEYAWGAGSCDPCPGPTLDAATIASLGGDVLWSDAAPTGPLGLPPGEVDASAEEPFLATDPAVYGKYRERRREPSRAWGPGEGPNGLTLTRLHLRLDPGDPGEDLVLAAAPAIQGGTASRLGPGFDVREREARPSAIDRFQARYVIRHPWTGPVACGHPERGAWGGPPAGAAGLAVAAGAASVRREVSLTEHLVGEPPLVDGAPLPRDEAPPAAAECGRCQADGGAGLGALLAWLLGRRRRRR